VNEQVNDFMVFSMEFQSYPRLLKHLDFITEKPLTLLQINDWLRNSLQHLSTWQLSICSRR